MAKTKMAHVLFTSATRGVSRLRETVIFQIADVLGICTLKILVAVLALAAGALPASASETPTPSLTEADVSTWLDSYLPPALHIGDIAGAEVVVVKDGKVLVERGYGYSDVAKHTRVDPKVTVFRMASISKLFTWTAVMQLVEQGKIDLDVDVNQYLDFKIPPRSGGPITMRNLMQHTAGFEEVYRNLLADDPKVQTYEAWLKSWIPERVFPSGTTPAYSNYGGTLAGYIVQRVSGEPFDAYIEKHIFQPLDMQHSTFREPLPATLAPFMSQGYATASQPPHKFELTRPVPVSALTSSADDMAHFMIAHLQDGEYMGNRILRTQTAQLMHNSPLTVLPGIDRMELGFYETNINGREVIGHTGDTSWFHSALHLFTKEGVGLFFSFNSQGKAGAVGALRTALFEAFADRYFPGPAQTQQVDATTAAAHAKLLTGYWISSQRSQSGFPAILTLFPGSQPRVSLNAKGELVLPGLGPAGEPLHWVEASPFVWTEADTHLRIAAKIVDRQAVMLGSNHSPASVLLRPQWYQNAAWVLPAVVVSTYALLLTALGWPIAAIVRRLRRTPLNLDASSYRAYRGSKVAAIIIVAAWSLWGVTMQQQVANLGVPDSQVRIAQYFGLIAYIGGLGLMLWNLRMVWSGRRRWPAKTWSIVLVLSAVVVLWVAWVFNLIGLSLNY